MPKIPSRNVTVAVDMYGCPNRCRHCWLGPPPEGRITKDDLRRIAAQFRGYTRKGETKPFIDTLKIMSWIWEPDFPDNYQELYALERELSDGDPRRFELLSVWRLARDEEYAEWAKEVGPDTCQITFFGMEETTDWFYRREGAFQDCVKATERLLKGGMKPRWQFFFTKKILPELEDLLDLVDRMDLRDRVRSLGSEFELFMHPPGPDGEARNIEHLRPTLDDVDSVPAELIKASQRHYDTPNVWQTEAELIAEIMEEEDSFPYGYSHPEIFGFYVTSTWNVFSNMGTLEPWWNLGNLKEDPVKTMFDRFERNTPLGFHTIFNVSPKQLVETFGDPHSERIYTNKDDLLSLYVARYCEKHYSIH